MSLWKPNEYTLNFDTNKGTGSTTPDPVEAYTIYFDGNYGTGEDAALPETSRKGYTFTTWSPSNYTSVPVTGNLTVTALYKKGTASTGESGTGDISSDAAGQLPLAMT